VKACGQTIEECDSMKLASAIRNACLGCRSRVANKHQAMMRKLAAFLFAGDVLIMPTTGSDGIPYASNFISNT
jgi:hypothetical protein